MKAATSSLAFAALVTFGGLVCPCFSSNNAYLDLCNCLNDHVDGETLSDKILSLRKLVELRGHKFAKGYWEFQDLVFAFTNLNEDDDNEKFCYKDALTGLRVLVEAAVNCDITPTDSHTSVEKLNDLLVRLKKKVRARCYEHIKSEWDKMKSVYIHEQLVKDEMFMSINSMVWAQHDLLRSLIYRPKNAPDSDIVADTNRIEDILFRSIINADERFKDGQLSYDSLKIYMNRFFVDPCRDIIHYSISGPATEPLKELLALEMMNLPGDQNLTEDKMPYSLIPLLPTYLTCKWFVSKSRPQREVMISSLHERFAKYQSAQGRRFFI